jgi:hypothetical protein
VRVSASDENSVSFRHSSRSRPMKLSTSAFCCGFPRRDVVPVDACCLAPGQDRHAVNSVPLSETHVLGLPRHAITASSSRATRAPHSDVSATSAAGSRVRSLALCRSRRSRWAPQLRLSLATWQSRKW